MHIDFKNLKFFVSAIFRTSSGDSSSAPFFALLPATMRAWGVVEAEVVGANGCS